VPFRDSLWRPRKLLDGRRKREAIPRGAKKAKRRRASHSSNWKGCSEADGGGKAVELIRFWADF